mgnify:CR=1 FL=1
MNPIRPSPRLREIPTLIRSCPSMLRDLLQGRYRQVPVGTMTGAILGLIYLINPLDLVPDVIPLLGIVDDSLVVGLFLALFSRDVKKYILWKKSNTRTHTSKKTSPPTSR